jgi:uncharacterized pyridoxamine 5'-phosphate oxidase family protein
MSGALVHITPDWRLRRTRIRIKVDFNTLTVCSNIFLDTFDDLEEDYRLDNPDFQIFYADDIEATIYDYDGNARSIK